MLNIKVLNSENSGENDFLSISEFKTVKNFKNMIFKSSKIKTSSLEGDYDLFFNKFILDDEKLIRFYKLKSNDEIQLGKIENILQENEIILEVFIAGWIGEFFHLIFNKTERILDLKLILNEFVYDFFNIDVWNVKGNKLNDEQTFSEIDLFGDYCRIIVGVGDICNEMFNECCALHDTVVLGNYNNWNLMETSNDSVLSDYYEKYISSIVSDCFDEEIINNFQNMRKSFKDCKFLFSIRITNRIIDRLLLKHQSTIKRATNEQSLFDAVINLLRISIQVVIFEFFFDESLIMDYKSQFESMTDKISKLLNRLIKNDWNAINKLLVHLMLNNFTECDIFHNYTPPHQYIALRSGLTIITKVKISRKITTVYQAKIAISMNTGLSVSELYLIDTGKQHKPSDDDLFEIDYEHKYKNFDDYFFEIVLQMTNIEVLKLLGLGVFGSTYLVKDKLTNSVFVIKKQNQSKGLYRDISIHSRLWKSKYIVCFLGLYFDGISICLATEYLPGNSLISYLIKHNFIPTENELSKICYEILVQLKEIHKRKIIHRDIKCDNIVFDGNNSAKIIDFGYAKCISRLTAGDLMENLKCYKPGNVHFMAPEIINCEPYSEKVDIWSFGVTVIQMITGKLPYFGLTDIQAALKIGREKKIDFSPVQPISVILKSFIDSCLDSDPNNRLSAHQLIQSEFISQYRKRN